MAGRQLLGSGLLRLWRQLSEVVLRKLRNSLLMTTAAGLLSSTGAWTYFASSFNAHDIVRAARWRSGPPHTQVVIVAIDEAAYQGSFGGRSPLDPGALAELLRAVGDGAAHARTIAVDIDASPLHAGDASPVVDLVRAGSASRWLFVDAGGAPGDVRMDAWRRALCRAGARFGHPYLPTEFGLASTAQQYRDGLADAVFRPSAICQRALAPSQPGAPAPELERVSMPLSPGYLQGAMVLPYRGDPAQLREALRALDPEVVLVGGMWGHLDLYLTPFGERHGVHLHAAAVAGELEGLRQTPFWLQWAYGWLSLSMLWMVYVLVFRWADRQVTPWRAAHPGHAYLVERLLPHSRWFVAIAGLLLLSELNAIILARTAWWLPSATLAGITLGELLTDTAPKPADIDGDHTVAQMWDELFVGPARADLCSASAACKRLWRGPAPAHPGAAPAMGRGRSLAELLLVATSLMLNTVLPLVSVAYAVLDLL